MTVSEIKELIAQGEGEAVEFKETTGQRGDACKTLCAFLNGRGGTVVFGVTRKGKLTGQLMADTTKRDLFEAFQKFEPSADIEVEYVLYLCKMIETWGRGIGVMASECRRVVLPLPTTVQEGGYVVTTFRRPNLSESGSNLDQRDPDVGKKLATKVSQKNEKIGQKRVAKVGQKSEKVGQKSEKVSQKQGAKVGQKFGEIVQKSEQTIEAVLPSLRKDIRGNVIKVLAAIGVDSRVTIRETARHAGISATTVKASLSLLKEVGILYRIGGDRGGHWLISWKSSK